MLIDALKWYLLVMLAGWVAFPLMWKLLPGLADRGYHLSKMAGLLIAGYIYWVMASFGVLTADVGGALAALAGLAALSWVALRGDWPNLKDWLNQHKDVVITGEALFLAAFAFITVVRAAVPEAVYTEKPMELAFINAILKSPTFPPHDPWLSGYAISYYYFGYVMVAWLARLAAVSGGVAFNLAVISWYALSALGAYSIVYNVLGEKRRATLGALFGPSFFIFAGNLEGFLELLHARGLFWVTGPDGSLHSSFWTWLGVQDLTNPPSVPFSWIPGRLMTGWWWWRGSRVLQDFDINGGAREIIDEMPAFSYILGDLHPHVLAVPFVFLAIGLALNAFRCEPEQRFSPLAWLRSPRGWLVSLSLGGLAFLNTWDFPMYLALFAAVYALRVIHREGWTWNVAWEMATAGAVVGLTGAVLYLPFFIGFASQAGGFIPSMVFQTRGAHFWVMFGTLLIPIFLWLGLAWRNPSAPRRLRTGVQFAGTVLGGLIIASLGLGAVIAALPSLPGELSARGQEAANAFLGAFGAVNFSNLVFESLMRRATQPGAWITLGALLVGVAGLLFDRRARTAQEEAAPEPGLGMENQGFLLLILLLGAGLATFPEFFYLRDLFGYRINTIFKFYYQAWLLFSIGAGVATVWLMDRSSRYARVGYAISCLALLAGLVYPVYGYWSRTGGFTPATWTLDGTAYLAASNPAEAQAIQFLETQPVDVVAEATKQGASYQPEFARVATFTGFPGVLGWPGHESQWRGGYEEMGSRLEDLELLYRGNSWEEASKIIDRYDIRYIYVGPTERAQYRVVESKFEQHLPVIFRNDQVIIYQVP